MKRTILLLLPLAVAALAGFQYHELPTAAAPPGASFLQVSLPNTFIGVGAGFFHTCVLSSSGAVECWGWDDYGQAPASSSASGTTAVTVYPTASSSATPASVAADQPFTLR